MQTARYIAGRTECIDPADRGLAYGDGLFETMALREGQIRHLEHHLARLAAGCNRLQIPMPEQSELEQQIRSASGDTTHGTIKLILTRGTGPRGYAPPSRSLPTVILFVDAGPSCVDTTLSVATLKTPLGENPSLAGIKHLCRLEQVLGRLELMSLDADEGLMATTRGAVIGGTSRNIFAVFGRSLRTPDLGQAGIAGVMRRVVLEAAATSGYTPEVTSVSLPDLRSADEIFMTNALVGIQSVARLDDLEFHQFPAAEHFRSALGLEHAS